MNSQTHDPRRASLAHRAVRFVVAHAVGVGLVGVVAVPAHAATHNVSTDAELRAAITIAGDTDIISFGGPIAVTGGDLPALDSAVTINGNGHTLNLNGTPSLLVENTDVTINQLTVSSGAVTNLEFDNVGGALNSVTLTGSAGAGLSYTSTVMERHLVVTASTFTLNTGAGISLTHGAATTVTVQGGTITSNAVGILAAVSQDGEVSVSGTTINFNTNEGVHVSSLTDAAVVSFDAVNIALNGN